MQKQPDFRLKEMQDLLEGRDLKDETLTTPAGTREINADLVGAGQIGGENENEEQDEMIKLQNQVVRKNIEAATKHLAGSDSARRRAIGSLKERGVTDKLEMARMLPTNKYFQDFVREHQ